jgi:IS6 family transposase
MKKLNDFKWRHYLPEIILFCARWYLKSNLSYQDLSNMMKERGLSMDKSCIWRWVQVYGQEINRKARVYLKKTGTSYRVDETYIKVKGQWKYLYRVVDKQGSTLDFLLCAKRDAESASIVNRSASTITRRHSIDGSNCKSGRKRPCCIIKFLAKLPGIMRLSSHSVQA